MDRPNHNSSQLQMLDLCSCRGLSAEAIMLPLPVYAFHRLRWLGIGLTDIVAKRGIFTAICEARPRLCCDFGCCDGWQCNKVRSLKLRRARGRPKKYRRKVMRHDIEQLQLIEDMTLDRNVWRLWIRVEG
ncbi:hypothetical protein FXO37_01674 [Capsicum annuum]|nr:hypothetical protein FXO37_01674 [Capsicum annuum]